MNALLQEIIFKQLNLIADNEGKPLALDMANIQISTPKDLKHGDITTNIALTQAKGLGLPPRKIAEQLANALKQHPSIAQVDIAGPGFINCFLNQDEKHQIITDILSNGRTFGLSKIGEGQSVHLEYVSANPTGPLHVGHGRGAAYGASLANILKAAGYSVHREYYVNDAGRQMNILALSVWFRYLECLETFGADFEFPSNAYQGEYIKVIAERLLTQHGDVYSRPQEAIFADIPKVDTSAGDEQQKEQNESRLDALIDRAQTLLADDYDTIFNAGLIEIQSDIKSDLEAFGVTYDTWFSERSLTESGKINMAIDLLTEQGLTYENNGSLWFKSTAFGDDKDRVMIRKSGASTYFASDIAYHLHKLQGNYSRLIDIWGADHHGYIARVNAAIEALSKGSNQANLKETPSSHSPLTVLLVQFAILYRKGQRVQMSTRSGSFVTLRELREEVGNDAARFFYVMRKSEQHMDFDLDLAKSQTKDNPVYYIQYAHARICQLRANALKQLEVEPETLLYQLEKSNLGLLESKQEEKLVKKLTQYPEILKRAANQYEPHQLAHYLRDLASDFHTFYNDKPILKADADLLEARLALSFATQIVIANGLSLLGVSAPESM